MSNPKLDNGIKFFMELGPLHMALKTMALAIFY